MTEYPEQLDVEAASSDEEEQPTSDAADEGVSEEVVKVVASEISAPAEMPELPPAPAPAPAPADVQWEAPVVQDLEPEPAVPENLSPWMWRSIPSQLREYMEGLQPMLVRQA